MRKPVSDVDQRNQESSSHRHWASEKFAGVHDARLSLDALAQCRRAMLCNGETTVAQHF